MHFRNSFYVLLCVAVPQKPDRPTIVTVRIWSITISYKPPPGVDTSRHIVYVVQYSKKGQTDMVSLPETTKTTVIITKLQPSTQYVIKVAVKYVGGEFGTPSDPAQAATHPGKCFKTSYR